MAAIYEHKEPIKLDPVPGFVVKTKIVDGLGDHLYSTKVFINICHDVQVPKPSDEFEPEKIFPKIVNNEWEVPIIVSPEKTAKDKKGVPSFVYDCCINSECFQWVQLNKDLRLIVVEWCIEAIEMMYALVLEREYSLPKMLSKGELSRTEISPEELKNGLQTRLQELKQNEQLALVQELEPESDSETLPSLTDIQGTKSRPLIQEISDMSISGSSEREHKEAKGTEKKQTQKSMAKNNGISETKPISYTFTVSSKTSGDHFYLKFTSPELAPMLQVTAGENTINITNSNPERKLGATNTLQFGIPKNATPYKCFIVDKEKSLYVFCLLQ